MEKLFKFGRILRNNWKKSIVAAVAVSYGISAGVEKYKINILMKVACKEAALYGDGLIPMNVNPTVVTVILNPVANKRKAKKDFEKYCEPLLHLAGLQVNIAQTTSEGNAKEIVENLSGTEAIIVAGGDGTLAETVTGLLRRTDEANRFPLGILPLGKTNSIGNSLFPGGRGVEKVKQLIEASMAIIKGNTELKDAMKIEPIAEDDEIPSKPIYALNSIEWGAFRDTLKRKDKYWILGPLREYAAFLFNGYKDSLAWECCGVIKYTPPCTGCKNCVLKKPEIKRNWSFLLVSAQKSKQVDYRKVVNPECSSTHELCFKTCEFKIITPNINKEYSNIPALKLILGKNKYSYTDFVSEGWNRLKGITVKSDALHMRTIEFLPKNMESTAMIAIDNEEFELKPLKITFLPKIVKFFCTT